MAGVPIYQPSTVVSRSVGSLVLKSPDSVGMVGDYYDHALDEGGWTKVSASVTHYSASFTVKKSGRGASISVSPGIGSSGSVISISTYPSA